jgi:hypothetical protein
MTTEEDTEGLTADDTGGLIQDDPTGEQVGVCSLDGAICVVDLALYYELEAGGQFIEALYGELVSKQDMQTGTLLP